VRLFVKGATEAIVDLCTDIIGEDGATEELTGELKDKILGEDGIMKNFAAKCYRCLAVSYRDFTSEEWEAIAEENGQFKKLAEVNSEALESNLTMACIFGLVDPLRPGINAAIKQCHKSGINVRMCTGDNIDTARAISLAAGIVT
jgi:P-type E1-E2 ATPase